MKTFFNCASLADREEPMDNIDLADVDSELPLAKFSMVGPDPTNNQGAGPFKFSKPTTPPPVEKKSQTDQKVFVKTPKGKVHVATISDETPLYLNYADKVDGTKSVLKPVVVPSQPMEDKPEAGDGKVVVENIPISEDGFQTEDSEEEQTMVILPEEEFEGDNKEVDFSQRLAFPDISGKQIETVNEEESEEEQQPSEETELQV